MPDRRLGQHFLLDPTILDRIAALAEPLAGTTVVEVGPGPGGLTRALLARGARVIAIERDPRCLAALASLKNASGDALRLIAGDALKVRLEDLGAEGSFTLVANLPYNIGTRLLIDWLQDLALVRAMHLMFQKEVALRLIASPRTADYGRLSVMAQLLCRVERRFDLPAGAFHPPPKVASSVVSLWPHAVRPSPEEVAALGQVTGAAFGQRRKMLRSSLKGLGVPAEDLLAACGLDPTARAEELPPKRFLELARALSPAGRGTA